MRQFLDKSRRFPSPGLVVGAVALAVALGGTATAAGLMVTSANIRNGSIQLVDINKRARAKLKGTRGVRGKPGPLGPVGSAGPPGQGGPAGAQGAQGPQGATGPSGPQGATGSAGPQGATGPAGPQGATGPSGPQGADSASEAFGRINGLTLLVTTQFAGPVGASSVATLESDVTMLSAKASATARDLAVELTVAPGVGNTRTFTLRVDGIDTAVSCTIAGSATTCDSGNTTVPIAPAGELAIKVTGTGTPAAASALFGWRATG